MDKHSLVANYPWPTSACRTVKFEVLRFPEAAKAHSAHLSLGQRLVTDYTPLHSRCSHVCSTVRIRDLVERLAGAAGKHATVTNPVKQEPLHAS
jgi:hypothetical protein